MENARWFMWASDIDDDVADDEIMLAVDAVVVDAEAVTSTDIMVVPARTSPATRDEGDLVMLLVLLLRRNIGVCILLIS